MLKQLVEWLDVAIIIGVIGFWFAVGGAIECWISDSYMKNESITPEAIYRYTKLNKFGCWFLFILISIISPFGFVMKIGSFIGQKIWCFIKYIFTVGRM